MMFSQLAFDHHKPEPGRAIFLALQHSQYANRVAIYCV